MTWDVAPILAWGGFSLGYLAGFASAGILLRSRIAEWRRISADAREMVRRVEAANRETEGLLARKRELDEERIAWQAQRFRVHPEYVE